MSLDNRQQNIESYLHMRYSKQKLADQYRFEIIKKEQWAKFETKISKKTITTPKQNTNRFQIDLLVSAAVAALLLTSLSIPPKMAQMAEAIEPGLSELSTELNIENINLRYEEFRYIFQKTGVDVFSTLKVYRKP